jgi:hypothetical protein
VVVGRGFPSVDSGSETDYIQIADMRKERPEVGIGKTLID